MSQLKKEFQKRDVERIRNLVKGNRNNLIKVWVGG